MLSFTRPQESWKPKGRGGESQNGDLEADPESDNMILNLLIGNVKDGRVFKPNIFPLMSLHTVLEARAVFWEENMLHSVPGSDFSSAPLAAN